MSIAFELSKHQRELFHSDGYLIVPNLFSSDEVKAIQHITELVLCDDPARIDRHDADGLTTKLSLRNSVGEDVYGATVRCERVARTAEALLEAEVYHYHHKVMIKDPRVGGAWEWHQDYGYWYENGCLRPDMLSCMIAITAASSANGCVDVVPGSHKLGRLEHVEVNDQVVADPVRVDVAVKRYGSVACELEAGDGVFFHCNLLHRSLSNQSYEPRLSLINCYNTRENDPFLEHHHPQYSPLSIVDDSEVLRAAGRQLATLRSEDFNEG